LDGEMEGDTYSGRVATNDGSAGSTGLVCLAGPPGSGKSTAGLILAGRLGVPFRDLDGLIEADAGRSIPEIFGADGEAAFRGLELRCLLRELDRDGSAVLALGGGCLLSGVALEAVLARATLVTLWASDAALTGRCGAGSRPLAASGEDLRSLLDRRSEHYLSLPNRIDTTALTPEETADAVEDLLRGLRRYRGRTGGPSR
jgi:shikimate kinase